MIDLLTLPPDNYQRYRAAAQIANEIKEFLRLPNLTLLDVGGFSPTPWGQIITPLGHFLPEEHVVTVDLIPGSLPNFAQADGLSLPFADRAFDVVVSCDTYEHIPPKVRARFVEEVLRVSRHCTVLIAPFDSASSRQAERLLQGYLAGRGLVCPPLEEHLEHELPSADTLRQQFAERGLVSRDYADGYLPHWLAMILITFTPGQPEAFYQSLNRCYNRRFSPSDRREPAYRRVFAATQPVNEALLGRLDNRFLVGAVVSEDADLSFAEDLIEALGQVQPSTTEAVAQLRVLETENARLLELVSDYERGRFMSLMRWLHGRWDRLRKVWRWR